MRIIQIWVWVIAGCAFAAVDEKPKTIEIKADAGWVDTEVDVEAGEQLRISAEGSVEYSAKNGPQKTGPKGLGRSWRDLVKTYPVNEAGRGALVGRFGDNAAARAFLVGEKWEGRAPVKERLFLSLNQADGERADGSFRATIERIAPAPAATDDAALKLPVLTQERLDQIPPRVQDAAGTPGDRVNFVLIGSKERVEEAFKAAGWVVVDKDTRAAVLQGILGTLSRQAYVTMPMSDLLLFGRTQDYGYAQGDPVRVVAARHHFRIWEAPFKLESQTVWAGAGTHDIGFDRDQRNGKLTHKIDPDTDLERDYIGESLKSAGFVAKTEYMTAKNTVKEAKTAHGGEFHSDGRTLIIYLRPSGFGNSSN